MCGCQAKTHHNIWSSNRILVRTHICQTEDLSECVLVKTDDWFFNTQSAITVISGWMCLSSTRPIQMCLSCRRPIKMCVFQADDQSECVFVMQKTNQNVCLSCRRPIGSVFVKQKTNRNACLSCRRPIRMCVCHTEDQSEMCLLSWWPTGMCVCQAEDQSECVFVMLKTNQKCVCQAEDQLENVFVMQKTSQNVWSSSRRLTRIALRTVANNHHNEMRQSEGLEAGVWFLDATVGTCGHCFMTLPSAS